MAAVAAAAAAAPTAAVVSDLRSRCFPGLSWDKVELGGLLSKDDVIETRDDEGRNAKLGRELPVLPVVVVVPLGLLVMLLVLGLLALRLFGT